MPFLELSRTIMVRALFLLVAIHQSLSATTAGYVAHSTSSRTHYSSSKNTCWASSSTRGNSKASEIMDTIRTRYGHGALTNTAWTKTRNYVYQASDRLTLEQVNDVLWFLDERKLLLLLFLVLVSRADTLCYFKSFLLRWCGPS